MISLYSDVTIVHDQVGFTWSKVIIDSKYETLVLMLPDRGIFLPKLKNSDKDFEI